MCGFQTRALFIKLSFRVQLPAIGLKRYEVVRTADFFEISIITIIYSYIQIIFNFFM
jgi:hypothetical protein